MDHFTLHRRALLGLIAAGAAVRGTRAMAEPPKVGDVAPDFQLTLMDNSRVRFADLRGTVIMLNLWATWCGPCRTELPLLDRYYRARRDSGLRVFAVATEDSLPIYQMRELFRAMTIPSARRIRGPYAALGAMPTNYVIDRAGRIRHARAGAFNLASLNELLIPLLNERPPAA